MKKLCLLILTLFIISGKSTFATDINVDILSNEPQFNFSIAVAPLTVYGNNKMIAVGGEISSTYIFKNFGSAHISGGTTYISINNFASEADKTAENTINISGKRAFGEFSLNYFFYKRNYIKNIPSAIGSAMSGNTQIDYNVIMDTKFKVLSGVRIGGIYEYSKADYDEEINYATGETRTITEKNQGAQIFVGLNAFTMNDLIFKLVDKEMIDRFGEKHRNASLTSFYLDLIIDPLKISTFSDLGFRLGIMSENDSLFHFKLELGVSPMLGFYGTVGLGLGFVL